MYYIILHREPKAIIKQLSQHNKSLKPTVNKQHLDINGQ